MTGGQKCFFYTEPLLGAHGESSNAFTYTAVKLARKYKSPIIIIPFGIGNTSILEWAYGDLSIFHSLILEKIKLSGLTPTIFLWHQGESDAKVNSIQRNKFKKAPYFSKPIGNHESLKKKLTSIRLVIYKTQSIFL